MIVFEHDTKIFHAAVHLVGGRIDERRFGVDRPRAFEHVERAERVGVKIIARIAHAERHCDLPRKMQDDIDVRMILKRFQHGRPVGDVDVHVRDLALLLQPLQVVIRPRARQIIDDYDFVASLQITSRCVTTDESGAAGD